MDKEDISPEPETYPSKRIPREDRLTLRQFLLPIILNGTMTWGVVDYGAPVSLIPYAAAEGIGIDPELRDTEDKYKLAKLIEIPYFTKEMDMAILEPNMEALRDLDLNQYGENPKIAINLRNVEFRIGEHPNQRIARNGNIDLDDVWFVENSNIPYVILGVKGVMERLNVSFSGKNSISLKRKEVI